MKFLLRLSLTLLAIAPTVSGFSKTFKSDFIRFELPPNWSCAQEELDWTCSPDNLAERSEAIVVVATKTANEVDDTLPKYKEILETPKPMRDLLGNAYTSQVKYVKERTIRGHVWMDALLLGSEIPGFYTRNVATIKEKVAGLISYSVGESVYPKYAAQMDAMIDTLEISFDPKAYNELLKQGPVSLLGRNHRANMRKGAVDPVPAAAPSKGDEGPPMAVGVIAIIAIVAYVIWRRKQS